MIILNAILREGFRFGDAEQKDSTKVESETDPDLSLDEKQPDQEAAETEQQKPAKKTVKED